MQETWFDSWVGKIPSRRKWQPAPDCSPGKSPGQRSLQGCSPEGHREPDSERQLVKTVKMINVADDSKETKLCVWGFINSFENLLEISILLRTMDPLKSYVHYPVIL